jgi:hypothetical protein
MLEELYAEAAGKTRLDERQVKNALGGSLALIRKHAEPAKTAALFNEVPGAEALAAAGAVVPKGSGLFGGLMKSVGGAGGAAMSDALALQGRLGKEGITQQDLKQLLPIARAFVQRKTGKDLLGETLRSIPGVGSMLGGE